MDIKNPMQTFDPLLFNEVFNCCSGGFFSLHAALLFTPNIQKDIICNRPFNHRRSHQTRKKKKNKEIKSKAIIKRTTLAKKKNHFLSAHIAANKCRIMIEPDPGHTPRLGKWKKIDSLKKARYTSYNAHRRGTTIIILSYMVYTRLKID